MPVPTSLSSRTYPNGTYGTVSLQFIIFKTNHIEIDRVILVALVA
jgi:hypothetical protein